MKEKLLKIISDHSKTYSVRKVDQLELAEQIMELFVEETAKINKKLKTFKNENNL